MDNILEVMNKEILERLKFIFDGLARRITFFYVCGK